MIELVFRQGHFYSFVKIAGASVVMGSDPTMLVPLELCRMDKSSTLNEFPDLANDKNWKEKSVERWNAHIKSLGDEEKIADYVIADLNKYGYQLTGRKDG